MLKTFEIFPSTREFAKDLVSLFLLLPVERIRNRPTLMGTKNIYENGPNPFFLFCFFQSYGNENDPDSYNQIRLSVSYKDYKRIWCPDSFAPAIQNSKGFRMRRNYYYIWPITLLELKYIITSARNAAAIAKGMVELRSIVFYSREERRRWRQGPRCLRCLKLRMVGGLGGLMMTPRRSSGCGACIPGLTTRRHHGRCYA